MSAGRGLWKPSGGVDTIVGGVSNMTTNESYKAPITDNEWNEDAPSSNSGGGWNPKPASTSAGGGWQPTEFTNGSSGDGTWGNDDSGSRRGGRGGGRGGRGRGGQNGERSNGFGGGGSSNCFKCNEAGHMARECPNAGDGGDRSGGGGSSNCYKCNQPGHIARDCPNPGESGGNRGGGDRKCFKCNETGHISRECPNPADGGGRSGVCYKCQQPGHISRDCPGSSGGDNGGEGWSNAPAWGNHGDDDDNPRGGGFNFRPPKRDDGGEEGGARGSRGGRGGRGGRDRGGGRSGEGGDEGGEDEEGADKPAPVTYIPPEPTNDETTIFDSGIHTGINFDRLDRIEADVSGDGAPPGINSFEASELRNLLKDNVKKSGYGKPTPVQKRAIPIIMAGRDLMACAQTGSGKTAAFMLPILHDLLANDVHVEGGLPQKPVALVMSPTRELAIQIHEQARKFSWGSTIKSEVIYGGTSTFHQGGKLLKGCHILVATPGRLADFVDKGKVSFDNLKYLVLDEADRMLDMGFLPSIQKVVENPSMPPKENRTALMFSATFAAEVQTCAKAFLKPDYLFLKVGLVGAACADVQQSVIEVTKFDKRNKLAEILNSREENDKIMIFVETKRTADFLATHLCQEGFPSTSIHGDRLQQQREEALVDFKSGHRPVIVATAVASRGLDIKGVTHVVNYDMPKSVDEFVHRCGRTGRVGNTGKATSFFDAEQNSDIVRDLVKVLNDAGQEVPQFLIDASQNFSSSSFGNSGGFDDVRGFENGGASSSSAVDDGEW